jgi:hypothetical protein
MIRRGFWLVTGAAIGVAGYRKAARLGRTLTAQPAPARLGSTARVRPGSAGPAALAGARRAPVPSWPARLAGGARSTAGFVRDVRAGMAEYRAGHGPAGSEALPSSPRAEQYRALQSAGEGRSLGSRSLENPGDQARPGSSQRGQREF